MLIKNKCYFLCLLMLVMAESAWSLPFILTPVGTLPTTVTKGSTVPASYTVTNNTGALRSGNYVKYLPPNVTIAAGGCGGSFDLAPGASCVLNLTIAGPVNSCDPDPHHHLFVCFPGGITCAGPAQPLNVSLI